MIHIFEKGKSDDTIIALHGTGGHERDLIPFVKMMNPDANILSIRGNIQEHGMNRYFKRIKPGVFDLESLRHETENLYDFIKSSVEKYQLKSDKIQVFGYSNGANIAINLMFTFENIFSDAILFHPMIPQKEINIKHLNKTKVFICAGKNDPIISIKESNDLIHIFQKLEAVLSVYWSESGHTISNKSFQEAINWYKNREV